MRELQRSVNSNEFAMWGVYFERRASARQRRAGGAAQQRDPREVYQEFRAALLTYSGVKQHGR